jgi:ABC-2 type transport system permease protein
MLGLFKKEINTFFSSVTGYLVMIVFLVSIGLFMWVFTDTSVLEYNFATMDQLFSIAPLVFLFLIPAITMKSISEEYAQGTIELLNTKPISVSQIVAGKFLANVALVFFSLLPTVIYYYSIYYLGSPPGNLDTGAIIGSYLGLFLLACCFVSIGMFASSLTRNQIVAFIFGAFFCFFFHWAFSFLSRLPFFSGSFDLVIQKLGINYHYTNISRGLLDSRDIMYFFSIIALFLIATIQVLEKKK